MSQSGPRLPEHLGLCPVHAEEFYMPLDDYDSLRCPVAGCDNDLVLYLRLPQPTKPSERAMQIARGRFGGSGQHTLPPAVGAEPDDTSRGPSE